MSLHFLEHVFNHFPSISRRFPCRFPTISRRFSVDKFPSIFSSIRIASTIFPFIQTFSNLSKSVQNRSISFNIVQDQKWFKRFKLVQNRSTSFNGVHNCSKLFERANTNNNIYVFFVSREWSKTLNAHVITLSSHVIEHVHHI